MMNTSQLLTSIKMKLGIYGLSLPIDDIDSHIHNVLKLETIKTYSQFFPQTITMDLRISELEEIAKTGSKRTLLLPDIFGGRNIISIRDVELGNGDLYANVSSPDMSIGSGLYESAALAHAYSHLASAVAPSFTFQYEHPNILHLYNADSYSSRMTIHIDLEHFENLSSIPPSQWESFKELATLDCMIYLYGIMKHYTDLSTAIGNINLKIDDWAEAANKRESIIQEWTSSFHLESLPIFYI